jgi:hypothetical protein
MSRKMVLVPEVVLNELKGKLPKPPEFQSTIGLQSDLDDIVYRDDLSPEEKVALYGHQLHCYREYLQQARQPAKPVIPIALGNSPAKPPAPEPVAEAVAGAAGGSDIEQQILESVSKPGQKIAYSLLKHLKNSSVDLDSGGRNRLQRTTHTVDLMTEAQKQKPLKHRELPPGFDEFAQALKETNTTKAWLTNPTLIKAMEKPWKISKPKPVYESGFQEASLYETPRRMTSDYVKIASKKPWMR